MTRKCTIEIVMKHAHAWNWNGKGGRDLCHKQPTKPSARALLQRNGRICEDT
jgi:hypothetical protein